MSTVDILGQAALYGLAWIGISVGMTFILAAAFFGFKEEKNLEENQDDI